MSVYRTFRAMTRTPSLSQISLMKELQFVLHEVSNSENQSSGALFSYAGPLNNKTNEAIITLSENAIIMCGYPRVEMLRAKNVVTECLQNVIRHGFIDDNGETLLYLTLECTGQGLKIKCGNYINDDMAISLKSKIDEVNGFSQSDLRKRSVELMCKSDIPSHKNAGLGLINIGINSVSPLDYTIEQKEISQQLFTLTLFVDNSKS